MLSQADFNFYAVQAALLGFLLWWFRNPIWRWASARWRLGQGAYRKVVERRKRLESQDQDRVEEPEQVVEEVCHETSGTRQRAKKGKTSKLQELSASELLEAVVSSDSELVVSPAKEVHHVHHEHQEDVVHGEPERAKASLLSRSTEVSIMQDLRLQEADESIVAAVRSCSLDLFECDVCDMVSKKNRLKVSGCLRWTGCDWEALGLALYRLHPHVLQVVYVGVLPDYRGQYVGRALVKSLKELARKDPSCLSLVAVQSAEAAQFFKAIGFRLEDKVMRLDVRKRKNESSAQGQGLLAWDEVLSQAKTSSERRKRVKQVAPRREPEPPEPAEEPSLDPSPSSQAEAKPDAPAAPAAAPAAAAPAAAPAVPVAPAAAAPKEPSRARARVSKETDWLPTLRHLR